MLSRLFWPVRTLTRWRGVSSVIYHLNTARARLFFSFLVPRSECSPTEDRVTTDSQLCPFPTRKVTRQIGDSNGVLWFFRVRKGEIACEKKRVRQWSFFVSASPLLTSIRLWVSRVANILMGEVKSVPISRLVLAEIRVGEGVSTLE